MSRKQTHIGIYTEQKERLQDVKFRYMQLRNKRRLSDNDFIMEAVELIDKIIYKANQK